MIYCYSNLSLSVFFKILLFLLKEILKEKNIRKHVKGFCILLFYMGHFGLT